MTKAKITQKQLEKYADVLVNFALNSGKGIKKGQVVLVQVPECAKPMLIHIRRAVLKAGGHAIMQYLPDDVSREYFELASKEQLEFFPKKYLKGLIDTIDHSIYIIAETNKQELVGIDTKKIMLRQNSHKQYMDWRNDKENQGKFTWCLAMYVTKEMAKEAGLSEQAYWDEIVKACYLDERDPVQKWKDLYKEMERVRRALNKLKIEKVHMESKNTDLWVKLGPDRKWLGGSGRNIPSFELFISPDWRGTNGVYKFTEPLYAYGHLVTDGEITFKNGKVVKVKAKKGEKLFKEMVKQPNANKLGEYSLTDKKFSRITKFMGETLFDENVGGKYGNTHVAVGMAYKDSFRGNPAKVSKKQWEKMGFNDSSVHTDVVSTENRKVTAYLPGGKTKVIYENGEFQV